MFEALCIVVEVETEGVRGGGMGWTSVAAVRCDAGDATKKNVMPQKQLGQSRCDIDTAWEKERGWKPTNQKGRGWKLAAHRR